MSTPRPGYARASFLITFLAVLASCSSAPYRHGEFQPADLQSLAQTQEAGGIRVTAAVPGEAQTRDIFGLPLYDRGIQPVWLEIENRNAHSVRFAPTGADREYFSPLEVAYMHRKGYSKEARAEIEQRLFRMGMPRRIEADHSASGFVFTHRSPGTKDLLVDVFSLSDADQTFVFFLEVPGFVPDHSEVDFQALYKPEDVKQMDAGEFRAMLSAWPCCTANQEGSVTGLPIQVAMVGPGRDVLRALLRSGWHETEWTRERQSIDPARAHYLFGRLPDSVFRYRRQDGVERNEMHIWLAPWLVEGQPVWLAQVEHFIGQRTRIQQALFGSRFDPDMDEARNFLLQNLWYGQSLDKLAWLDTGRPVRTEDDRTDFLGAAYSTDGFRSVLWVSGEPVSMLETRRVDWDLPPGAAAR